MQDTQLAPRAHSDIRCLHFLCYVFSFPFFLFSSLLFVPSFLPFSSSSLHLVALSGIQRHHETIIAVFYGFTGWTLSPHCTLTFFFFFLYMFWCAEGSTKAGKRKGKA
ncbi:hypothetical protein LZ31DRAFT_260704 [Colletotrichum somersetense]|nr:hypothetical protein LZ31DRAFT_260704 [Colletotrichum somersetense]